MTNRRRFLGGTLAAVAAGWAGLARRARVVTPATLVDFYPLAPGGSGPKAGGPILGLTRRLGEPRRVDLRSVEVGHFHDLTREPTGRVAYLYEATLAEPDPRRGLVKLGETSLSSLG